MTMEERLKYANRFVKKEVEEAYRNDERKKRDFLSLAKRLPSLLLSSGLIVTIAYLKKRSKEEGERSEGSLEERSTDKKSPEPEELVLGYLTDCITRAGLLKEGHDLFEYLLSEDGPSPEHVSLMLDEALNSAEALKIISEARLGGKGGSPLGGQD